MHLTASGATVTVKCTAVELANKVKILTAAAAGVVAVVVAAAVAVVVVLF
jgi:hypothetical protein